MKSWKEAVLRESKLKEDIYSAKELMAIVDLRPLEAEVSKRLGTNVKFSKSLTRRGDSIALESQDLVNQSGIFKSVFDHVTAGTFNTAIDMNEQYWWATISLQWEGTSGSNRTQLLTMWYEIPINKWTFK